MDHPSPSVLQARFRKPVVQVVPPVAMRDGGAAALASGCSAVEARHLGGRAGLVDENELLGIEIELAVEPGRAGHFHIAALLLGRRSQRFVRSLARFSVTRPRMTSL